MIVEPSAAVCVCSTVAFFKRFAVSSSLPELLMYLPSGKASTFVNPTFWAVAPCSKASIFCVSVAVPKLMASPASVFRQFVVFGEEEGEEGVWVVEELIFCVSACAPALSCRFFPGVGLVFCDAGVEEAGVDVSA